MQRNDKNQEFINYWKFLEIPMNSPIEIIKIAFQSKFLEIENALDNKEQRFTKYTSNDLKIAIQAFKTLSEPYLRYLHNCEIDGVPTPTTRDLLEYLESSEEEIEVELNILKEYQFCEWLRLKIKEYYDSACFSSDKRSIYTWNVNKQIFEEIAFLLQSIQTNLEKNKQQQRGLNL